MISLDMPGHIIFGDHLIAKFTFLFFPFMNFWNMVRQFWFWSRWFLANWANKCVFMKLCISDISITLYLRMHVQIFMNPNSTTEFFTLRADNVKIPIFLIQSSTANFLPSKWQRIFSITIFLLNIDSILLSNIR